MEMNVEFTEIIHLSPRAPSTLILIAIPVRLRLGVATSFLRLLLGRRPTTNRCVPCSLMLLTQHHSLFAA